MNVRHGLLLGCILTVLLGTALFVTSTVSADHEHLIIYSIATWSCDNSSPNTVYWDITPREGTTTHVTLWNPRVDTHKEQTLPIYTNNFGFFSPPENTGAGDLLVYRVELLDSSGIVYATDQVAYNCSSGEQTNISGNYLPEDQRPVLPLAQPVSNASVEALLNQSYNGELTCGIFPVGWEDVYVISPVVFSPCAQYWPEVAVACLTAEGEWSGEEVHEPVLHDDGLYIPITQTGLCGVFPTATEP